MAKQDMPRLSVFEYEALLSNLRCNKIFLSPGDDACKTARRKEGADPEDVGQGLDTMAFFHEQFPDVCKGCPALIRACLQTLANLAATVKPQ
jgi:hypothetical protein